MANYAFIDSQNLNIGIRSQGWALDWKKFRAYLTEKYLVEKAFMFIGFQPGNEELYTYIQKCGYQLVFKHIHESSDGTVKGNTDAELVLHSMIELSNYDKAVIVSGDSDFFCLIEHLYKIDKLEKVLVPNSRFAVIYKNYESYLDRLDEHKKELRYYKKIKKPSIKTRS